MKANSYKFIFLLTFLFGACTFVHAQFAGGTGTESNPWQITTLAQLNAVRDNQGNSVSPVFYKLVNNLVFTAGDDLNGAAAGNIDPIPLNYASFDGNGKTITGVVIEKTANNVGLFSQISSGCYVRHLGLVDCSITGTSYVGGIAGQNNGEITACFVSGTVTASGNYAGGITGYLNYSGLNTGVNACYNAATVSGATSGGIAGYLSYCCINNCYNIGTVSGTNAGAIVGNGRSSVVADCFYLSGTASVGSGYTDKNYPVSTQALSETEMKAAAFLNSLNEPFVINYWKAGNGDNKGFPILAWQNSGTIDRRGETAANPLLITNLQELDKMRNYILMYRYFRLENDLNFGATDLNGSASGNFDPIGKGSLNYGLAFAGEFDGNNKKITGLQIGRDYYAGLFGDMNGVIKKLSVENAAISGNSYVGGFAGNFSGALENCSFSGTVTANGGNLGNVGGLVGYVWTCKSIKNCTNKGVVTGKAGVGGIAGSITYSGVTSPTGIITGCVNEGAVQGLAGGSGIAGIVGSIQVCKMSECRNSGTVNAPDCNYVAGMAGTTNIAEITRSFNEGNVTGKNNVGGVIGSHGTGSLPLAGCYNTGNITGEQYVGGIYGATKDYNTTSNVVHWGSAGGASGTYPSPLFVGCFNTGEVTGKQDVGGIAPGKYTSGGCFYIKEKVHSNDRKVIEIEEGAQGVTLEQLKSHVVVGAMNVAIRNSFSDLDNRYWHYVSGSLPSYYEPAGGEAPVYTVQLSVAPFGVPVEIDGIRFNTKASGYYSSFTLPEGDYTVKLGDYADNTKQAYRVNPNNNNIISLNTGITYIPDGSSRIYQLYTPEHVHLMRYANSSTFELMNDIAFESKHDFSLTEGNFYSIWRFAGSINGKGYAIQNLTIRGDSLDQVGLFQNVRNYTSLTQEVGFDSKIKNLRLENVNIKGRNYVGGIAGSAESSFRGNSKIHTIDSCFVSGVITGIRNVGGICGQTDYAVSNSVNTAGVNGTESVGGISGNANAVHTNNTNRGEIAGLENTGGIAGFLRNYATGCRNYGKITGYKYAGGIAGKVGLGSIPGTDYNTSGNISTGFNAGEVSASGAGAVAGGIAGTYSGNYYPGSVSGILAQSFNAGTVTVSGSDAQAGGLVGYSLADSIQACYNVGEIRADDAKSIIGGLIGYHQNGKIVSSYNAGYIVAENSNAGSVFGYGNNNYTAPVLDGLFLKLYYLKDENTNTNLPATGIWVKPGGIFPKLPEALTIEQLRHPDMLDSLNIVLTKPAWKADLTPNINNGFPILIWQTEGFTIGIKDIKHDLREIRINVREGMLTIDADDFRRASIYDISGKKISETSQTNVNVSHFHKGVYIVNIQTGSGISRQKILIK